MQITKKLKHVTFIYDEENKEFTIKTTPHGENEGGYSVGGNSVKLNKVYAFAFMRFVVRISQRNWLRSKKIVDKVDDIMVELESEDKEDPNQLKMFQ
jgi:hypothetical protein